jgi:cold shock CspA family protein
MGWQGRRFCLPEFGFPMHNQPPRSHVYRQPNVVATQVTATVKWFNPERGYGFVKVGDSGKDALLPASLVVPAGHTTLPDGATVVVDIVEDRKGQQVSVLHSVDLSTAAPARPQARERGFGDRGGDRGGERNFGDRGNRGFGDRRSRIRIGLWPRTLADRQRHPRRSRGCWLVYCNFTVRRIESFAAKPGWCKRARVASSGL